MSQPRPVLLLRPGGQRVPASAVDRRDCGRCPGRMRLRTPNAAPVDEPRLKESPHRRTSSYSHNVAVASIEGGADHIGMSIEARRAAFGRQIHRDDVMSRLLQMRSQDVPNTRRHAKHRGPEQMWSWVTMALLSAIHSAFIEKQDKHISTACMLGFMSETTSSSEPATGPVATAPPPPAASPPPHRLPPTPSRDATAGSPRWPPGSASWRASSSSSPPSSSPASSSARIPAATTAAGATAIAITASSSTGAGRRRCSRWAPAASSNAPGSSRRLDRVARTTRRHPPAHRARRRRRVRSPNSRNRRSAGKVRT